MIPDLKNLATSVSFAGAYAAPVCAGRR